MKLTTKSLRRFARVATVFLAALSSSCAAGSSILAILEEQCASQTLPFDEIADACKAYLKAIGGNPPAGVPKGAIYKKISIGYENMANAFLAQGKFDSTIASALTGLVADPTNSFILVSRGHAYLHIEEYKLARSDFEKLKKATDPSLSVIGAIGLANLERSLGNSESAVTLYDALLAKESNLTLFGAYLYSGRGMSRFQSGDYAGALNDFSRALKDTELASVRSAQAVVYSRLGDSQKALESYEIALRHSTRYDYEVLQRAAWFFATDTDGNRDPARAIALAEKALAAVTQAEVTDQEVAEYRYVLGIGLAAAGEDAQAEDQIASALDAYPQIQELVLQNLVRQGFVERSIGAMSGEGIWEAVRSCLLNSCVPAIGEWCGFRTSVPCREVLR